MQVLRWMTAGESHGQALAAILEGLPAGVAVTTTEIGLALGFLGWGELLVGVYAGFLLGAVVGGALAVAKVLDRRSFPFGPFMLVGAAMGVLLGPWLGSASPY